MAMFQPELQTYRKWVGKWGKNLPGKRFAHSQPWIPEKNYISILFLNMFRNKTTHPPKWNCFTISISRGKRPEKNIFICYL